MPRAHGRSTNELVERHVEVFPVLEGRGAGDPIREETANCPELVADFLFSLPAHPCCIAPHHTGATPSGLGSGARPSAGALPHPAQTATPTGTSCLHKKRRTDGKQTTKPTKTPHRTTTTDNTQQTNNDKTQGYPERPRPETQGGRGRQRRTAHSMERVVLGLAAEAARPKTTTSKEPCGAARAPQAAKRQVAQPRRSRGETQPRAQLPHQGSRLWIF